MPDGKWIPGLSIETPVASAARLVLAARLEVIRYFLPLAATEPGKDVEYVHQLRVATRRAGAALRIFDKCFTAKRGKAARRQVRFIRHAAGAARDWDVFQEALPKWQMQRTKPEVPGLDFLRGHAFAERIRAQAGLLEAAERGLDVDRILDDLNEPADSDDPQTLGELAQPLIAHLAHELDAAIAKVSDDYAQLHRVRILGKRLRYAMEVVADCFVPAFRDDVYSTVADMQEILGAANDSHVAVLRLTELRERLKTDRHADWPRFNVGIQRLLAAHRRRLPEARRKFTTWVKRWRSWRANAPVWELAEVPPQMIGESEKT